MSTIQQSLVVIFGLLSLYAMIMGFVESKYKNNSYGKTPHLLLTGSFVWADAAIFGFFWTITSVVIYFLNDWFLFLFVFSIFWAVRAHGEVTYWFNYQFSKFSRNPNDKMPILKQVFKDESIWFVWQITWQCITVVAIISSFYFGRLWLTSL